MSASNYKLVIAIDPGGTTGIALRGTNTGMKYLTCTTSTLEELVDFLWNQDITHLVVENFQAQTISKWGLYTVRLVGVCQTIAHIKHAKYVLHIPQDRYPFQQEAKALLEGRKTVIHEEDALAHLLRFEHDETQIR